MQIKWEELFWVYFKHIMREKNIESDSSTFLTNWQSAFHIITWHVRTGNLIHLFLQFVCDNMKSQIPIIYNIVRVKWLGSPVRRRINLLVPDVPCQIYTALTPFWVFGKIHNKAFMSRKRRDTSRVWHSSSFSKINLVKARRSDFSRFPFPLSAHNKRAK